MMMTPASSLEDRMRILEGYTVRMSEQLNDRMDRVLNVVIDLNTKVDRNHAELTGKIDELDGKVGALDSRIGRLEGRVDRNHAEVMAKLGELTSR